MAAAPAAPSAPPAPAATSPSKIPAGWAAGLDKEVDTIKPILINLWDTPGGLPPGATPSATPERDDGTGRIQNVSIPGLIVYLPPADKRPATGCTAIVECMGGAFNHLTRLVGADDTVPILVPKGIAVISLKYRLTPATKNVAEDSLADGQRALRLVRAHAKEWGIDPTKVGMLGWSAGSTLILNQSIHHDLGKKDAEDPVERESSLPNFVAMLSPWPNSKPITAYPVPPKPDTVPIAFIASAQDDKTAPFTFAKSIEQNWKDANTHVEFLETPTGGHASFEISSKDEGSKWPEKFLPWLEKEAMWKDPSKPNP
jgi:endo-1,4-beta-xylanase